MTLYCKMKVIGLNFTPAGKFPNQRGIPGYIQIRLSEVSLHVTELSSVNLSVVKHCTKAVWKAKQFLSNITQSQGFKLNLTVGHAPSLSRLNYSPF